LETFQITLHKTFAHVPASHPLPREEDQSAVETTNTICHEQGPFQALKSHTKEWVVK